MTRSETPGRSVACYHRRERGAYRIVFTDSQVREPDCDLAGFARRVMEEMRDRDLVAKSVPVPWGTASWTVPLTLAFLDDVGAGVNAWLRMRLGEARARAVTRL